MKISCPDCQASYDIDLPDLTKEAVEVKCVECQHSFWVTPEARPAKSPNSLLPDNPVEENREIKNQMPDEDDFDDMLDQLINEENDGYEKEEEGRINIGPISVPNTRTRKLMLAGGVLGLLATAGGAYFAWQIFAPPELTEIAKPEAEVPKGLTPKPDKEQAEKPAKPAVIEEDSEGLLAALPPESKMVKFSTIMPVAFEVNDIRVLSFTLEIIFTDEASAQIMQSALPLFEEATVKTVEKFLEKKFYDDILYVKEKLEQRLQAAYNNKIDSDGRVKKIKFKDFVIQ